MTLPIMDNPTEVSEVICLPSNNVDVGSLQLSERICAVVLFSFAQKEYGNSVQQPPHTHGWLTKNLNDEITQRGALGRPVKVRVLVTTSDRDARELHSLLEERNPNTEIICDHVPVESWTDYEQIYRCMRGWLVAYPWKPGLEEYFGDISTGTALMRAAMMQALGNGALPGHAMQMVGNVAHALNLQGIHFSANQVIFQTQNSDWLSARVKPAWGVPFTPEKEATRLIAQITEVVNDPILLLGDTGTGKTTLVKNFADTLKNKKKIVEVNCATIRGDTAKSELFGHKKGAFTGAVSNNVEFLKEAEGGILFLDEIGELGLQEQAMLLTALENQTFRSLGGGKSSSSFILFAGTNKNLDHAVKEGTFRRDLLERISAWTFRLPSIKECKDGIPDVINEAIAKFNTDSLKGLTANFDKSKAENAFISFASSDEALWPGNLRELRASIRRMATLAVASGSTVISLGIVEDEIKRLRNYWNALQESDPAMPPSDTPAECSDPAQSDHKSELHPKTAALVPSEITEDWEPYDFAHAEELINACLEAKSQLELIKNFFPTWYKNNCGPGKKPNISQKVSKELNSLGLCWKKGCLGKKDFKHKGASRPHAGIEQ